MITKSEICPICGEGCLTELIDKIPVEYKNYQTELNTHYSVCDSCGCEQANATQTRYNKRLMIAFKKQVDGLLTGAEITTIRLRLGITQKEAAVLFGGGPVAFSKYENDDVIQSESMDNLLYLADKLPVVLNSLATRKGIKLESKTRLSIVAANLPHYEREVIKTSDSKRQKIEIIPNSSSRNQSTLRYSR